MKHITVKIGGSFQPKKSGLYSPKNLGHLDWETWVPE